MFRIIFNSLFLLLVTPSLLWAQRGGHGGVGMHGGMSASHSTAYHPTFVSTNHYHQGGYAGGYYSGYYGYGYGFSGYANGSSSNVWFNNTSIVNNFGVSQTRILPVSLPSSLPAKLTVVFPGPAIISVNGKDVSGDPTVEKVLTSEPVPLNDWFTFKVSARWEAAGNTYLYTRDVSVPAGGRSCVIVLSGIPVKLEK